MSSKKRSQPSSPSFPWRAAVPTVLVMGLVGAYNYAREDMTELIGSGLNKAVHGAKELGLDLSSPKNKKFAHQRGWSSMRPILVDVDGDGRNEVFSIVRDHMMTSYSVKCMNNTDWSQRWATKIGPYKNALGTPQLRWLPEQQLFIASLGATIRALDPQSGEERWVAKGTDKVEKMGVAQGTLWVNTVDEKRLAIRAATGQALPSSTAWPKEMTYLASDADQEFLSRWQPFGDEQLKLKEVKLERTYCDATRMKVAQDGDRFVEHCTDPRGIAYATRRKGTELPFLVSYDREKKEGSWMTPLSDPEAIEVISREPMVTFSYPHDKAESVFAAYRIEDDPEVRLARISMKTGEMLALSSYTTSSHSFVHSISTDEHYLYMRVDEALLVLDPKEGDIVKQLGVIYSAKQ